MTLAHAAQRLHAERPVSDRGLRARCPAPCCDETGARLGPPPSPRAHREQAEGSAGKGAAEQHRREYRRDHRRHLSEVIPPGRSARNRMSPTMPEIIRPIASGGDDRNRSARSAAGLQEEVQAAGAGRRGALRSQPVAVRPSNAQGPLRSPSSLRPMARGPPSRPKKTARPGPRSPRRRRRPRPRPQTGPAGSAGGRGTGAGSAHRRVEAELRGTTTEAAPEAGSGRGVDLVDMNREWPGNENGPTPAAAQCRVGINAHNADFAIDYPGDDRFRGDGVQHNGGVPVRAMLELFPVGQIFDNPVYPVCCTTHSCKRASRPSGVGLRAASILESSCCLEAR